MMVVKFSGLLWPFHRFAHDSASVLPLYLITPGEPTATTTSPHTTSRPEDQLRGGY